MPATITRTSLLAAPAAEVWRHATSLDGVNREMAPWLRMTSPPELRERSLDDESVVLDEPLFTSSVRLFGAIPVDRMRVTLVELERGRRFVEQSPMLAMRRWRHEREIEPAGSGCRLRDTITFEPRVAAATWPMRRVLEAFFAHRHRVLTRLFGEPESARP